MKILLILFGFLVSLNFYSEIISKNALTNNIHQENTSIKKEVVSQTRAYICGGQYAKKFHSRSNCRGLNNCRSKIYYYDSQKEAIDNGYKYCLICWK